MICVLSHATSHVTIFQFLNNHLFTIDPFNQRGFRIQLLTIQHYLSLRFNSILSLVMEAQLGSSVANSQPQPWNRIYSLLFYSCCKRLWKPYFIFPRMQIHYKILCFGIPKIQFTFKAMWVGCHLAGIKAAIGRFIASLGGYRSLMEETYVNILQYILYWNNTLASGIVLSMATTSVGSLVTVWLEGSSFNGALGSPSTPNQFSALCMEIKSFINCSSVFPPISPPLPLRGPNTSWLYNGSLTMG